MNNEHENTYIKNVDEKQGSNKLSVQVKKIYSDMVAIKKLIRDTPNSPSPVFLINKDIDFLKNEINSLNKRIDKVWSDFKWIIGFTITILIGLYLALAGWFFSSLK